MQVRQIRWKFPRDYSEAYDRNVTDIARNALNTLRQAAYGRG
ncbi:hypothetical protein [Nonomuraea aridisoli]|nr:hypothetical protein [Nonomuraea aridisoli]